MYAAWGISSINVISWKIVQPIEISKFYDMLNILRIILHIL